MDATERRRWVAEQIAAQTALLPRDDLGNLTEVRPSWSTLADEPDTVTAPTAPERRLPTANPAAGAAGFGPSTPNIDQQIADAAANGDVLAQIVAIGRKAAQPHGAPAWAEGMGRSTPGPRPAA